MSMEQAERYLSIVKEIKCIVEDCKESLRPGMSSRDIEIYNDILDIVEKFSKLDPIEIPASTPKKSVIQYIQAVPSFYFASRCCV